MAPRQLTRLLALPPALRPLLLAGASPYSTWPLSRQLHTSSSLYANSKPASAASVGAFAIPHSPTLPLSEVLISDLLAPSQSHPASLADELTSFFTKNPATFYHGTGDFYTLKKNTRIPEICILGRSNVGKSTFVNGLAGRTTSQLARTSSKAGHTRAMNAYGFGPAPLLKDIHTDDKKTRRTEDLPQHSLYIIDTPGYGFKSLKTWGKDISLYLSKRKMLKGAILLVDGEVGPKDSDLEALELLCEIGLKTSVVLTKADKAKNNEMLQTTCNSVWEALRETGSRHPNTRWEWEQDLFVTSMGSAKGSVAPTMTVARLAVARLAGLVGEKKRPELEQPQGWSGKVVSFEDLQYAPAAQGQTKRPLLEEQNKRSARQRSAVDALEQASRKQDKSRASLDRMAKTSAESWSKPNSRHAQVRWFSMGATRMSQSTGPPDPRNVPAREPTTSDTSQPKSTVNPRKPPQPQSSTTGLSKSELQVALKEFMATLKPSEPMPIDKLGIDWDKETPITPWKWEHNRSWGTPIPKKKQSKAQMAKKQKTQSVAQEIAQRRVQKEELRALLAAERERRKAMEDKQDEEVDRWRDREPSRVMSATDFKRALKGDENEELIDEEEEEDDEGDEDDEVDHTATNEGRNRKSRFKKKLERKVAKRAERNLPRKLKKKLQEDKENAAVGDHAESRNP